MKLTDDEHKAIQKRIAAMLDELSEMTGGAPVLLLIEQAHTDNTHTIFMNRRGSPYATCRMAQIYAKQDDNEDLANDLADVIGPRSQDDGEDWQG